MALEFTREELIEIKNLCDKREEIPEDEPTNEEFQMLEQIRTKILEELL